MSRNESSEESSAFLALQEAISEFGNTMSNLSASSTTTATLAALGPNVSTGYVAATGTGTGISGTGNFYPTYPYVQPIQQPWSGITPERCPLGHIADESTLEYVNGTVVGACITCNGRMIVNRVAGGVSLLEIQHLLGRVMSLDEETMQLEEFSLGEILGEFSDARDRLEKEEFAVRQARKLIDLAMTVLTERTKHED